MTDTSTLEEDSIAAQQLRPAMPEAARRHLDIFDMLRARVEAGEPIYIDGPSDAAISRLIERLDGETGKRPTVIQTIASHNPLAVTRPR